MAGVCCSNRKRLRIHRRGVTGPYFPGGHSSFGERRNYRTDNERGREPDFFFSNGSKLQGPVPVKQVLYKQLQIAQLQVPEYSAEESEKKKKEKKKKLLRYREAAATETNMSRQGERSDRITLDSCGWRG